MNRTATNDRRPQRRNLFSAAFHANHASIGDMGFDNSDGDLSWATDQFDEDCQRRALNQQIQDKFRIKPKVQKIDNDDETWFSEASDAEGPAETTGPRKGKKKRRKAGAVGTKSPSAQSSNMLLQHPSKKDNDSSDEEENLFEFSADFGAFGNDDAFAGDLTQSSAADDLGFDSSNHNSQCDPFYPDASSMNGPRSRSGASITSFSSQVSGKKSVASSVKSNKTFSMVPVSGDETALKRIQSVSSCSRSLPGLDASEGAEEKDDAWLGTFIDNVMEEESKSQSHPPKVKASVSAAAAAMNRKSQQGGKTLSAESTHSVESQNASPAKKVYMMKPKRAVDPLSASDHGPRRHSRGGAAAAVAKPGQRAKLGRQRSDPAIMEESAASLNASSLLHGSSSLQAGGSFQANMNGSKQASQASLNASEMSFGTSQLGLEASCRSTFHSSQPVRNNGAGSREQNRPMHASQPIKSLHTGNKPRRKVVRKVARPPSGENGMSGPPRRRRVQGRSNSMSGSSDDGGEGGGARRIVRRRPSGNTESSEPKPKGAPVKKKVIHRRSSDGGAFGGASVKPRSISQENDKVSQVAVVARTNMARVQAELKQGGPRRQLKPKGAPKAKAPLGLAIEQGSQPAKRQLRRQNSASSMPAASSGGIPTGGATGRKPAARTGGDVATARTPDEAKKAMQASSTALERHMVKRRPVRKPGGPSGSASLAGHEMKSKKKVAPGLSDLASTLPGGGPKFSGSASVAGDQVAVRRPGVKRLVKKKPAGSGNEGAPPLRRKPLSPDKPRPVRTAPQREIVA